MKIERATLNIHSAAGDSITLELSPVQLQAVCQILGIEPDNNNSVKCYSDESIKLLVAKTIGRLQEVKDHENH